MQIMEDVVYSAEKYEGRSSVTVVWGIHWVGTAKHVMVRISIKQFHWDCKLQFTV